MTANNARRTMASKKATADSTPAKAPVVKKSAAAKDAKPKADKSKARTVAKPPAELPAEETRSVTLEDGSVVYETARILYRALAGVCKIAGLDTPWNDADPLCDYRIYEPWFLDAPMQASLAAEGQEEPGECVVRDGVFFINRGRRREANLREVVKSFPGTERFFYFYIDDKSTTDEALYAAQVRSNGEGLRRGDSALTRARKYDRARRLYGWTVPYYAGLEGVHEDTIRSELALLKLPEELQAETIAGRIGKIEAILLGKCGAHDEIRAIYTDLNSRGALSRESIKAAHKAAEATRKALADAEAAGVYGVMFAKAGIDAPVPASALAPPTGRALAPEAYVAPDESAVTALPPVSLFAPSTIVGDAFAAGVPLGLRLDPSDVGYAFGTAPEAQAPAPVNVRAPGKAFVAWTMTEVRKGLALLRSGVLDIEASDELAKALEVLTGDRDPASVPVLADIAKRIR